MLFPAYSSRAASFWAVPSFSALARLPIRLANTVYRSPECTNACTACTFRQPWRRRQGLRQGPLCVGMCSMILKCWAAVLQGMNGLVCSSQACWHAQDCAQQLSWTKSRTVQTPHGLLLDCAIKAKWQHCRHLAGHLHVCALMPTALPLLDDGGVPSSACCFNACLMCPALAAPARAVQPLRANTLLAQRLCCFSSSWPNTGAVVFPTVAVAPLAIVGAAP